MKAILPFVLVIAVSVSAHAQGHRIETETREVDYYASVTDLAAGPILWDEAPTSPDEEGHRFRAAVVTSEIYDAVYIERVTYGMEGCCVRIASARRLDMTGLADAFELRGEVSGVSDLHWAEPDVLEFSLAGRRFRVEDLGSTEVLVREV
ncbi:MAG: hypothetical protein AAGI91_16655 [Bacteroidota bacterium]